MALLREIQSKTGVCAPYEIAIGTGAGDYYGVSMKLDKVADVPLAITGLTRTSNVVTVTTTADHDLSTGDTIKITGCTPGTFDGVYTVTGTPLSNTFTYDNVGGDESASVEGTYLADYGVKLMSVLWSLELDHVLDSGDDISYRFQFSPDPDFGTPANIIEGTALGIMPRYKQASGNKVENPIGSFLQTIGFAGECPATYIRIVFKVTGTLAAAVNIKVTPIFTPMFMPFMDWTEATIPTDGRP